MNSKLAAFPYNIHIACKYNILLDWSLNCQKYTQLYIYINKNSLLFLSRL